MRTRAKKRKGLSAVNAAGILAAAALFGYSLLLMPLSLQDASSYLAAASVSISAGVAPNPDNTLMQQLQEKAAQLDVQQRHIQELQQSLGNGSNDTLGLYSLIASMLLLLLVAANFYFDWRRSRDGGGVLTRALSVDLRTLRPK